MKIYPELFSLSSCMARSSLAARAMAHLNNQKMPLSTRRSFTRRRSRGVFAASAWWCPRITAVFVMRDLRVRFRSLIHGGTIDPR